MTRQLEGHQISTMSETQASIQHLEGEDISVALTHEPLDAREIMNQVKSPKAGAIVLFAGELDVIHQQSQI